MSGGFWIEPWWPYGDFRWAALAVIFLISALLTYIPSGWVTKKFPRLAHPALRRLGIGNMFLAKGNPQRIDSELKIGWEEEELDHLRSNQFDSRDWHNQAWEREQTEKRLKRKGLK